jgi:hypothetical protein
MINATGALAMSALTLALFTAGAWGQGDLRTYPGTSGTVPQGFDAVQTPGSSGTPMPQVHQDGGVSYVSGGVSDAEREQLAQLARGYTLQLEMAQASPAGAPNPYVANVGVVVTDEGGRTVLRARSDGPLFYAQLRPGRYRISATSEEGRTASATVQLTGRGMQKVALRWPAEGPQG